MISILAALLFPALAGAKERSRRTNCRNSQRQFLLAAHMYADDNFQWLPSGTPDKPMPSNDDHLPVLSAVSSNSLFHYLRTDSVFYCPSFAEKLKQDTFIQRDAQGYGYVIGYNYHGGHINTPWPGFEQYGNIWVSPQKLTDPSSLVVLSDMNDWSYTEKRIWAPHTTRGPVLQTEPTGSRRTPADIGSAGGNLGLLDGSVSWKNIKLMRVYRGSQQWGNDGCIAMW